jgi:hypothetical protein
MFGLYRLLFGLEQDLRKQPHGVNLVAAPHGDAQWPFAVPLWF